MDKLIKIGYWIVMLGLLTLMFAPLGCGATGTPTKTQKDCNYQFNRE